MSIRPGWNYRHQIRLADTIMAIGAATTTANIWIGSTWAQIFAWIIIMIAFGKARYANGVRDGIATLTRQPVSDLDFTTREPHHD